MQRREFLVLTSLLIAGCATKPSAPPEAAGMRFSDAERKKIIDFYASAGGRARTGPVPVQRAKAGDLLVSGQRPNKLPVDLAKLLPDLPDPYTRLVLGADVLLLNRNSHMILDVIPQIAY
jgi:hypothetical protein